MKTLLVGYGNLSRRDDGAGVLVAEAVEKEAFDDVEVRTCQQLHVELLDEFSKFERIVLVDASTTGPEVELRKVRPSSEGHLASSHHLGPELLLRLAQLTRSGEPELYLCAVRGENFDFGEELSAEAAVRVRSAVDQIRSLIGKKGACHARS